MSARKPSPDDLKAYVRTSDLPDVSVEEDRSAIAYLRGVILGVLHDAQAGACFFCGEQMPQRCVGMHIHHEPPLSVRFPNGYGRPSTVHDLRLAHPACNLRHAKPRRHRGE